ncbi:hypothetical protein Q31b_05730 [Novipirellula aureliae]|uniref:Bacterial CdiA-CT RNAse A domain-containing protein n=1 Tax=Novipirellula aureliae TaxID=2527966 RepID=A0A5C6ECA4_9BACT|nr:hypothetical protein [Novipirellula aureliae]TWU45401.1 hypothetical protein Q31b_05730 [Novipirellula aureliae]
MNRLKSTLRTGVIDNNPPKSSNSMKKKSSIGAILLALLLGIYSFAQPVLNQHFGWDLPAFNAGNSAQNAEASKASDESSDRTSRPPTGSATKLPVPSESEAVPVASADDRVDGPELLYKILHEVSPQRYLSPAGLLYTPGSEEGHRLEHLRRHTADIPSRSGSHGVFDGGMEGALETIDKAYERAKREQRTTKTVDDNRTIYTVDMGGRIGFVGGQNGKRKGNPMARRVRLVLEGNRFITAFPL